MPGIGSGGSVFEPLNRMFRRLCCRFSKSATIDLKRVASLPEQQPVGSNNVTEVTLRAISGENKTLSFNIDNTLSDLKAKATQLFGVDGSTTKVEFVYDGKILEDISNLSKGVTVTVVFSPSAALKESIDIFKKWTEKCNAPLEASTSVEEQIRIVHPYGHGHDFDLNPLECRDIDEFIRKVASNLGTLSNNITLSIGEEQLSYETELSALSGTVTVKFKKAPSAEQIQKYGVTLYCMSGEPVPIHEDLLYRHENLENLKTDISSSCSSGKKCDPIIYCNGKKVEKLSDINGDFLVDFDWNSEDISDLFDKKLRDCEDNLLENIKKDLKEEVEDIKIKRIVSLRREAIKLRLRMVI